MNDSELLSQVIGVIDCGPVVLSGLRRNGRLLLALPADKEATRRALRLYQPQRLMARAMVVLLRGLARIGIHGVILPAVRLQGDAVSISPPLPDVISGTCGVLVGSREHQIRRAVASYQTPNGWEVSKISFGIDGARLLEREAYVLEKISARVTAAPKSLGLHHGDGISLLRMGYITGRAIPSGDHAGALALLSSWVSDQPTMPSTNYAEWSYIENALRDFVASKRVLEHLVSFKLKPVICHGDFARWNLLKQANGELIVLDWEWGCDVGMPGIDLVHYFLQDVRLVRRMSTRSAIESTIRNLNRPECRAYLDQTGWSGDPLLPIAACLAYKQGAGHQDNREMLNEVLNYEFWMKEGSGPSHL